MPTAGDPRPLGYQEGGSIVSLAKRGWYPPIAVNLYDDEIPLPSGITSHAEWGKTKIVMGCSWGTLRIPNGKIGEP